MEKEKDRWTLSLLTAYYDHKEAVKAVIKIFIIKVLVRTSSLYSLILSIVAHLATTQKLINI